MRSLAGRSTELKFGRSIADDLRMRWPRRGLTWGTALVACLVLVAVAVTVNRTTGSSPLPMVPSRFVAVGAGDGRALPDDVTATTAPPASTTTVGRPVATTIEPTTTIRLAPSTSTSTTTAAKPTTTLAAPPTTEASPSSWAIEENGISIRVRIEPARPVAGEPLRFVVDTVTTSGDYCCVNTLYVNGAIVDYPSGGPFGCPAPSSTHEIETVVAPHADWLNFFLDAGRLTSCSGQPPAITEARLSGSARLSR